MLKSCCSSSSLEVAETCQLALSRIEWLSSASEQCGDENPYLSVDPAPPAQEKDVQKLRARLLGEDLPLFERYRAMFALRNLGTEEAVLSLADGTETSFHCLHLLLKELLTNALMNLLVL